MSYPETFLLSDGAVSIVTHDRTRLLVWIDTFIAAGLAPTVLRWSSDLGMPIQHNEEVIQ